MATAISAKPIPSTENRSLTMALGHLIGFRLRTLSLFVRSLEDALQHPEFTVNRPRL